MKWNTFKRIDSLVGWGVFAIAAIVYLMTIGPSASLWDCAEFIVTIHKLEVGHPPGAPFFMLVYNAATQLTNDPTKVGLICNAVSALLSAFTILFLFWSITHLVRRLLAPGIRLGHTASGDPVALTRVQAWVIWLSGIAGALVYTFSDTFWYSAVEAEVYAFSSFFTALVFWLMLEWEDHAHQPNSDRWLILIAYFMGLGIGVHLLNLLCIPALSLIYYYKRNSKPTLKGAVGALLVSFALIVVMMYGIIQGLPKVGFAFDKIAVNSLGLSYNSGFMFYLILLAAVLAWSTWAFYKGRSEKHCRLSLFASIVTIGIPFMSSSPILWIVLLAALAYLVFRFKAIALHQWAVIQIALVTIVIGTLSYGVILIRSAAGVPMNENAPKTALSLKRYLNREQYGERPLFMGPSFASKIVGYGKATPVLGNAPKVDESTPDRYVTLYQQDKPQYDSETLFPRMYSTDPTHIQTYNLWTGRRPNDMSKPTFAQNLRFFFSYQLNFMYWRYFGWNFIGRQNDLYADGSSLRGGVSTGIPIIDQLSVGTLQDLPQEITHNRGHNVYYLLPFLLGFLGIAFQLMRSSRGVQSFWVVFFLFFMTGIAIVIYLNQTPIQPRERDYSYAGSFYAFAIWVGMGIAGLYELLRRTKLPEPIVIVPCALLAIGVPLQMAGQNWDDHDRSGRTVAADLGYNYLIGCDKNAVLFDFGDNDTFPLWYVQEVENIRPDITVANLSYLGGEWYIEQLRKPIYEASPMPHKNLGIDFYYYNPIAFLQEGPSLTLDEGLQAVAKSPGYMKALLPSQKLTLPLDREQVAQRYPLLSAEAVPESMFINLEGQRYIGREKMAILDMLAANQWQRPIYWARSTPVNAFNNLPDYFSPEGILWKLHPINVKGTPYAMDVEKNYDLVMNQYRWFGADYPNVYFDENIRNTIGAYYRGQIFSDLATTLVAQGDTARARNVLKKCFAVLPEKALPYTRSDLLLARACYQAGMKKEADAVVQKIGAMYVQKLRWLSRLGMGTERQRDIFAQQLSMGEFDEVILGLRLAVQVAREHQSDILDASVQEIVALLRPFYGKEVEQQLLPKRAEPEPITEDTDASQRYE